MTPAICRGLARASVAAAMWVASLAGPAAAYVLLDSPPSGRLTMNLSMQELIGDQPISEAMAKWNQVGIGPGQDHAFFAAQPANTSGSCGRNQINEVTSSDTNCGLAFGESTLAVTAVWWSSGKVVEADIIFNNTKRWSSYSGPLLRNGSGMVVLDINRIALHELGHAAGLNHPDQAGQTVDSIMNSYVGDMDALQADDIAGAHAIAWQADANAGVPVCTLTASPPQISAGGSATLSVACSPAATTYTWANTGFAGTAASGVVSPAASTTYSVTGTNGAGIGMPATVTVIVATAAAAPDLEVVSLTGPGNGNTGGQVTLTAEVRNRGGATNLPVRVGFYLSRDQAFASTDPLIGSCTFGVGLMAGQTHVCFGAGTVPTNLTAGTYILRAVVDDNLSIPESNEGNNTTMATPDVFIVFAATPPVCQLVASPGAIHAGAATTLSASCSPAASSYIWTNTGFGGSASGGVVAPVSTTSYTVVGVNAAGQSSPAGVIVSVSSGAANNYADIWWSGNAENGWGLSINQHGNNLFSTLYVYDDAGLPVWYVIPSGSWDGALTTFTGLAYQPASAPLNAYTPARFAPGSSVGSVTITFTSQSTAVLQYTINGRAGQKAIERLPFGSATAPLDVADMWWAGAAEDGWGLSLTQHQGSVFGAWYTYGPDGRAQWYVLPSGTWNGTTYSGSFYSTTSSPWLGAAYDQTRLAVSVAGTMSLAFTGNGNAVMTYSFTSGPFAGTTQSRQIARQAF
ncbi:MAG: CARDB domain-containing protein [Betaproteobacteria bacterium]